MEHSEYAAMLPDQMGGNYVITPIKERLGGTTSNYDGNTDIGSTSRGNYTMGRIVVGRAQGWTEKDFNSDISGDDYSAGAGEVAEFWDDVDQDTILSVMKGVFGMSKGEGKKFVEEHTYDVTGDANGNFDATTLNNGMQKALGDKKAKFSMAIMHSMVATHLENLQLLEYMKYTDAQGIERPMALATLNGRLVLVDDTMPAEQVDAVYAKSTDTQVVEGKTYYTKSHTVVASPTGNPSESDYYELVSEAYTEYTTYVFGQGAIEYTNCGTKTPSEMDRDPKKNGGESTLYSRQRKVFAPYGISFKNTGIISPTAEQLEDGNNWEIAWNNSSSDSRYFPLKAINIARIKTRG